MSTMFLRHYQLFCDIAPTPTPSSSFPSSRLALLLGSGSRPLRPCFLASPFNFLFHLPFPPKGLLTNLLIFPSITSYGDRPMEFEAVVNYFKQHFTQVHKRNNENKRVLYTHLTSVVVSDHPHLTLTLTSLSCIIIGILKNGFLTLSLFF